MDAESDTSVKGQQDPAALAVALRRVVGVFVRAVRGEAGTPGSSQAETLALLADKGPMTIAALAHLRQVKHQSMRLVLAQLEENGLVTSRDDSLDRRSRSVAITDKGGDALARDRAVRARVIEDRIRDVLTCDERAVLAAALPLLERLCYVSPPGSGASRLR